MLAPGTNTLDTLFGLVEPILRAIIIGIDLQRLRKRCRRRIILREFRIRDAQIVINVRIVLFQLCRFPVLANRFSILTEVRVSLSESVMRFRVVRVLLEVLLVSVNGVLILRLSLFTFPERLKPQRQPEM